ncbi:MAG: hypothetical protein QOH47_2867 [Sphingomonadales bacterium]|jgi:hypothetical protein|nr:hypothetical protein [Sphingomonadales bacterium]
MRRLVGLLLLMLATPAFAHGDLREIRAGEPVVLRPDRAYLLFRTLQPPRVVPNSPVFLRIPTAAELDRYRQARARAYQAASPDLTRRYEEARQRQSNGAAPPRPPSLETFNFVYTEQQNVDFVSLGRPFVRGRPESLYLVETTPGDYVFYGLRYGGGSIGALHVCWCLGTVGFSADAGSITDLGYILSDRIHEVSALPELAAESGYGPSIYGPLILWGATVRPVRPDSSVPESLRTLPIRPGRYRAVGRFLEPRALAINRLAVVPGILDYDDRGRVVDPTTSRHVPDIVSSE